MRNEEKFDKLIGIIDGQAYFLQTIFDHGGGFRGATGFNLRPITQAQLDEYNDPDNAMEYYRDFWQELAGFGDTEIGLREWTENAVQDQSGMYPGHDESYYNIYQNNEQLAELFPDAVTFESGGGGRCFNVDMKWDTLINPELWAKIVVAETKVPVTVNDEFREEPK